MFIKLQEKSHNSLLLAKVFLQERAKNRKKMPNLPAAALKRLPDPIFGDSGMLMPTLKVSHDMEVSAKLEECAGQEVVVMETRIDGTVDDFDGAEGALESEKRLLKFVLIKAYQVALAQNKAKNGKPSVTIILDANTKVTLQPTFVTTHELDFISLPTTSTTHKAMKLLTVFSKAEFDLLRKKYSNA